MADLRQTKEFAHYLRLTGWRTEKVNHDYLFIRPIPLTPFSLIKIQRPKKIPFEKINQLAKKHRAIQIIIEPAADGSKAAAKALQKHGYRLTQSTFLPSKTLWLDLNQSEKDLLAQMKKDGRYSLRKAKKQAFKIQAAKNLTKFRRTWRKAVGWRKYVPSLKTLRALNIAFGPKAIFLSADGDGQTLAGTIILLGTQRAYYYYAFTSKKGRQKLAQYFLVWETIKLAKKKGCRWFDFEGIYDTRFPHQSWQGFSHFKKSFGGQEMAYPGCWQKLNFPL